MDNYSKSLLEIITFSKEVFGDLSIHKEPKNLYEPINYILSKSGKQMRSILALLTHQMFGGVIGDLKSIILAIEGLHNFTLIHDDVMDNATLRRGLKTINKKWSNNQAILSGDALLIKSYYHLLDSPITDLRIIKKFTNTALLICEGQQLDFDFQLKNQITMDEYFKMIELKTGALITFSLVASCSCTKLGLQNENIMSSIGSVLGKLFQIQDDYLDLYGEERVLGKRIGGDIIENKKTFIYLTALQKCGVKDRQELEALYHSNSKNKITKVRAIYNDLDVQKDILKIIANLSQDLEKLITKITIRENKKELFSNFIKIILDRNS